MSHEEKDKAALGCLGIGMSEYSQNCRTDVVAQNRAWCPQDSQKDTYHLPIASPFTFSLPEPYHENRHMKCGWGMGDVVSQPQTGASLNPGGSTAKAIHLPAT